MNIKPFLIIALILLIGCVKEELSIINDLEYLSFQNLIDKNLLNSSVNLTILEMYSDGEFVIFILNASGKNVSVKEKLTPLFSTGLQWKEQISRGDFYTERLK